ncbi:hypothetical protein J7443_24740 [Tropicibacter sp. R15_0]|uniref:hypothetical protein n=1 Tax=Tropicibacter sp. R15_0 TaxID=2821101 RepID=UPI001ADB9658|nr:hypothetical protein [Tropicibacter sp. R15_0]MBO9468454.1 hypothetical protein [Tropicibacter sp. R15_0]
MTAQTVASKVSGDRQFDLALKALEDDFERAAGSFSEDKLQTLQQDFEEIGFVQIENVFGAYNLARAFRHIERDNRQRFNNALKPERPDISKAHTGFSLSRIFLEAEIDADRPEDSTWHQVQAQLLKTGEALAGSMAPVLRKITGVTQYAGCKIFAYDEGDYLSMHNDAQLGERVNMLLPVSFNSVGCIRILYDERLHVYYDSPGCINILGPSIWHDVPPLLRYDAQNRPLRMNFVIRFE